MMIGMRSNVERFDSNGNESWTIHSNQRKNQKKKKTAGETVVNHHGGQLDLMCKYADLGEAQSKL